MGAWLTVGVGASLLAVFLAIRTRVEDFRSLSNLRQINMARLILVLLYFVSYVFVKGHTAVCPDAHQHPRWIFFVLTGVLEQGVGLFISRTACATGLYSCITLYSVCKLLVYLFLGEPSIQHELVPKLNTTIQRKEYAWYGPPPSSLHDINLQLT